MQGHTTKSHSSMAIPIAMFLSFLTIPLEIRLQIYHLLLINRSITIRSLFIRTNYRNIFMSQTPCHLSTNLLRVCKQITAEALPVLYSGPCFHCPCRVEQLSAQIGLANFSRIRHMSIDADDLGAIAAALVGSESTPGLQYPSLESLETEGVRSVSLTESASRADLLDALKLCRTAQQIVEARPTLSVVGQDATVWNGGSDAVDESYARVKWRFLRCKAMLRPGERVWDVERMVEVLEDMLGRRGEDGWAAQMRTWRERGTYVQYPYLTT